MNKFLFFLYICLVISFQNESKACINSYFEIIPGVGWEDLYDDEITEPNVNTFELQEFVNLKLEEFKKQVKVEHVDLAIALLYLRNYSEALEVMEKVYEKFPREYSVVATYAACLELNGKFEDALSYLKKAVRIKPDSHRGSEWIHIKILEDFISEQPNVYSVIDFDFGTDSIPVLLNKTKFHLDTLASHLALQMRERIYFIPGHNPAFGKLYFDLANTLTLKKDYYYAKEYYDLAIRYGYKNDLVYNRIGYITEMSERQDAENEKEKNEVKPIKKKVDEREEFNWKDILKITIPLITIIVLVIIIWFRNRLYRSHWKR